MTAYYYKYNRTESREAHVSSVHCSKGANNPDRPIHSWATGHKTFNSSDWSAVWLTSIFWRYRSHSQPRYMVFVL